MIYSDSGIVFHEKKNCSIDVISAGFLNIVLILIYFIKGANGGIHFISLRSGIHWNIDKSKLDSYSDNIANTGSKPKVFVILSNKNNTTVDGAGWGDDDPAIYAEWSRFFEWDILN